jgi:hypothetical protein
MPLCPPSQSIVAPITSHSRRIAEYVNKGERKEAAMLNQGYLLLVLVLIALFFSKWDAGHWKH